MPQSRSSSQDMEQMFRDLGMIPKDIYSDMFSKKSNCPRVLRNKISCDPSNEERMTQIMCRAWYRVTTKCGEDTLLVEQFRDNLHKVWKEYNTACNRTPTKSKSKIKAKTKMIEKPTGGWF